MATQQIKAYVEVQSLAQLTQFNNVSGEQVVRAYQLTNRLRDNITNILSALAGQRGPYVICGPRGVGKSHLMALIRALALEPRLADLLRDPAIHSSAYKLTGEKFFPIELHITGDEPPDLLSLLRHELATREYSPLTFSDGEWETSMTGDRIFKLIKSKLPPGHVMVLFIDGLSSIMRISKKVRAGLYTWLNWSAERFREQNQALIVTIDEDMLVDNAEVTRRFQIERVDISNLREIADRHIFKKNDGQRGELIALYNDMQRLMPQFSWSREDFTALFPIHPAVLEVAPGLRAYSRTFTFFGFITAAASRAMNRRAMNLSSLDELFDSFEFDLRKNEQLAPALAAYDRIIQNGIPKLTGFDDKLWAKLALKALFMFSLCNKAVNLNKLADSVMLYDDRDFAAAYKKMSAIADCFIQTAPEIISVSGEGTSRAYRFVLETPSNPNEMLESAAREIPDNDPRLATLLVAAGGSFFADWPLKAEGTSMVVPRAELSVAWRGTMRRGLLKFGAAVELSPVDTPVAQPTPEVVAVGVDLGNAEILSEDDSLPTIEVMIDTDTDINVHGPEEHAQMNEFDWQISLIEINAGIPADAPQFAPPTLFYWLPARPSADDMSALKQAVVLRERGKELADEGIDIRQLEERLTTQLKNAFRRLYIDGGRLRNPSSEKLTLIDPPAESGATLTELLPQVLSEALSARYPLHPNFSAQLTEYEVLRLAVGLFGGMNPSSPTVQSYAETYALPMHLVSKDKTGEYRLDLDNESPCPAVAEVLRLVTATEQNSVPMSEIYQALRREPFGLQLPAQRLVLLALIAAWRIELVDDTGNRALGASQLSDEGEFRQYTQVRVPATINYPTKLLGEWYALLTAQDSDIDLVSPQGRRQMRDSLQAWRQNWLDLRLGDRIEILPADALTTRLWQIIVTCKRYFEAISSSIEAALNEEISIEMCLARIIDTFSVRESVYIKAVNELTLLINFLDWLPFYQETKNYILAAERTNDPQIETERHELAGFLTQSQRLLDDEKRQRYETVYRSFQSHYIEYYCAMHDNIVGVQATMEAVQELTSSRAWRSLELLSQLAMANRQYYRLALDLVRAVKESACHLPVRDLLHHQPYCACSFRINRTVDLNVSIEALKLIVEQGTNYHQRLLAQYSPHLPRLTDARTEKEAENIRSLIAAAANGEFHEHVTLSAVEALNEAFMQAASPIGLMPSVKVGGRTTKQELRERFERWLENLPDEPGISLEFLDPVGLGDD